MTGQFYSTAFIASFILVTAAVSAYVVWANAKIRFSFQIISLIALSCVGTLVFQVVWRQGVQTDYDTVLFGFAIFTMQLFVPISIIFTERQWKLLKRYRIKTCDSIEKLRTTTRELSLVKWGFRILLYSSIVISVFYAASTAVFSHYAIHVAPCNEDYRHCPQLVTTLLMIRILQFLMYFAYTICAVLMCVFAYQMNKTIKETYEDWEMSCFEIVLHCFALVFPVLVLTLILVTGEGNMM